MVVVINLQSIIDSKLNKNCNNSQQNFLEKLDIPDTKACPERIYSDWSTQLLHYWDLRLDPTYWFIVKILYWKIYSWNHNIDHNDYYTFYNNNFIFWLFFSPLVDFQYCTFDFLYPLWLIAIRLALLEARLRLFLVNIVQRILKINKDQSFKWKSSRKMR